MPLPDAAAKPVVSAAAEHVRSQVEKLRARLQPVDSVKTSNIDYLDLGGKAKKQFGRLSVWGPEGGHPLGELAALLNPDALTAGLVLGGNGAVGHLSLRSPDGTDNATLEGGTLTLGGGGATGSVVMTEEGAYSVVLPGIVYTGAGSWTGGPSIMLNGLEGQLKVGSGESSVVLDGSTGDIRLTNADCAEEFDVAGEVEDLAPGSLVMAVSNGVELTAKPYDPRVIGIVSGAGEYRPGMVLDRRDTGRPRVPVALLGKVSALATAAAGAISPGDLLVSSAVPGQVMRATDRHRAFGAVIGKALGVVNPDTGLVPVLVGLR